MVDVPTPSEIAEEAEEGREPTSLGDVAAAAQNPSVGGDEVVPDRRDTGEEES